MKEFSKLDSLKHKLLPLLIFLYQEKMFHHRVGELKYTSREGRHKTSAEFHCHDVCPTEKELKPCYKKTWHF